MQLLGRDTVTGKAAAQGGIYAAPHVFDGTHPNMTPEMWKQIPAAMADPIAVFDSDSPAGRARGDLVFMLELTDANGATVVVPVALQAKGKLGARINIVKSAYAKESGGVPSNNGFIRQAKKCPLCERAKVEPWLRAAGAASPLGSLKDVAATNTSDNRIYTDADLVNLREAQPALYQPSAEARTLQAALCGHAPHRGRQHAVVRAGKGYRRRPPYEDARTNQDLTGSCQGMGAGAIPQGDDRHEWGYWLGGR